MDSELTSVVKEEEGKVVVVTMVKVVSEEVVVTVQKGVVILRGLRVTFCWHFR